MFTLEQKVDLILRYIATADKGKQNELKKLVLEALNSGEAPAPAPETPDVEELIIKMLNDIGIPQHIKGYYHVITAIKLSVENHDYLDCITKGLYPAVAEIHNTTGSRVERTIRHAIEVCFERCDISVLTSIFGNTISISRGKLTNSAFLAFCTNEISRKLKKLNAVK